MSRSPVALLVLTLLLAACGSAPAATQPTSPPAPTDAPAPTIAQINEGAPADVFASANRSQMEVAIASTRVVSGTQKTFVRNRLVAITPKDNPAGITTLQDLAKPGVKLILADSAVPVGQYSLDFLGKASALPEYSESYSPTVLANVVSYEDNVRSVLTKVALGEGDAGIVYTTDAALDADTIAQIDIPDELNTIASYPIAPLADSPNPELAQAFIDYVLSPEGQQILVKYGFIPTTSAVSGAAPGALAALFDGECQMRANAALLSLLRRAAHDNRAATG